MYPRAPFLTLILFLLVSIFIGTHFAGDSASARSSSTALSNLQLFPTPPNKITNALATVPADATGIPEQNPFDLFSWLTFIALNWPADTTTCEGDISKSILSGQGPVVWETYLSDSDVFVAPSSRPSVWCPQNSSASRSRLLGRLPANLRNLVQQNRVQKILFRQSKASDALGSNFPGIEAAVGGVLTDQNGRFVRYEITMNHDEYAYLTDPNNNLWNKAGQNKFSGPISFPVGPSNYGCVGAMEIKAAWKVLSLSEIASKRFYMTKAIVFNDDQGNPSPGSNPVTLGLVGLHIIHKTKKQPTWVWSTFEHVDNLQAPPGSPPGRKASFNNPGCPPAICPPNVQTAATPYTELNPNGTPINKPVQVTRVNPTGDSQAAILNKVFRGLLKGSVWENYQLISTQWVGEDGTLPKPPFLANVTLETFIQTPSPPSDGPVPFPSPGYNPFAQGKATSSCLKCHSVATTPSGKKSDFSFLMGEAQ